MSAITAALLANAFSRQVIGRFGRAAASGFDFLLKDSSDSEANSLTAGCCDAAQQLTSKTVPMTIARTIEAPIKLERDDTFQTLRHDFGAGKPSPQETNLTCGAHRIAIACVNELRHATYRFSRAAANRRSWARDIDAIMRTHRHEFQMGGDAYDLQRPKHPGNLV